MKQVCTVITVTRGAFDFSQSKPSKVKYKCYNTAWLRICLIYTHLPSGAVRPRASCVYIRQTPRGCIITYTYNIIYILKIFNLKGVIGIEKISDTSFMKKEHEQV